MSEASTYEQIEAFLAGKLAGEELQAFQEAMKADIDLQKEVSLHQQLAEATGGEHFHAFRAALKETDASWEAEKGDLLKGKVRKLSYWQLGLIAAGVVMLYAMLWLIFQNQPKSSRDLFATHFQPYEMVLSQRSAPTDQSAALEAAIAAYAKEAYAESEKQFQQLAEAYPDEPIYQLYACVSALADDRSETAINCFTKLQSTPNLAEQAQWYLGLSYLQQNDREAAKAAFNEIKQGAYQFEAAQEILEGL